MISGCNVSVPVATPFPEVPNLLLTYECEKLDLIEQEARLSDVVRSVTTNYIKYHECARMSEGWKDWYNEQKIIHDEAIKKTTR